jgi:hypothetical protein
LSQMALKHGRQENMLATRLGNSQYYENFKF